MALQYAPIGSDPARLAVSGVEMMPQSPEFARARSTT